MSAMGYGADYKYFFSRNALEDFDWSQCLNTLVELALNCLSIDRVLYPVVLVILVLTLVWKRRLWSNALFTASWLALAGQASFIFRLQDNDAPRYFLVMLAPIVLIAALMLDEVLADSNPSPITAALLLFAMAASATINAVMIEQFVAHPQRQFYDAANSIRRIIRSDPGQNQLISGVSGSQISLMTGIPCINDADSPQKRAAKNQPGWFLAWTELPSDAIARFSAFRLEEVASYPVFDDSGRTPLILFRMVRRAQ